MRSMISRGFLGVFCLFIAFASHAHAADFVPRVVERTSTQIFMFPFCGVGGPLDVADCNSSVADLLAHLRRAVEAHIAAAYEGRQIDPYSTDASSPYLPESVIRMQVPICNLEEKVFATSGGERQSNHKSQGCGTTCRIECVDEVCTASAPSCGAERAWGRGAFTQIVWKNHDEVAQELRANNRLEIRGRCQAPLNELIGNGQIQRMERTVGRWASTNANRKITCDVTPSGEQVKQTEPQMAACYLSAARRSLEMFIGHVAVCEALARAEEEWSIEGPRLDGVLTGLVETERARCYRPGISDSELQVCVEAGYQQNILNSLKGAMSAYAASPR